MNFRLGTGAFGTAPGSVAQPGGYSLLGRLQALDRPIPVAIAGAGAMGKGLFFQCFVTPGFRCVALADTDLAKAVACAQAMQLPYRVVHNAAAMHQAIAQGAVALCEDADLLAQCEHAEVFIDATSAIVEAARFCRTALQHGKHLVMMNAEADLAFGPELTRLAAEHGVVYTSCDGDQHGVIKRLVDDVRLWGFELVMAGNIKGFLDRNADPTSIIPEADKRNLDHRMCAAYTDGTKLAIEMALVANALGLKTAVPGMYGPRAATVEDALSLFDLDAIRNEHGAVVDYLLGSEPNGGVFAIGYCDALYQRQMMAYYKMGNGPYYVFYRPYHLCHVEAMQCVAEAYLDGRALLQPANGMCTDVYAYAKRDLPEGTVLDGIGGYACYGLLENKEPSSDSGVPICLSEGLRLSRSVKQGEKIWFSDVVTPAPARSNGLAGRALS